MGAPQQGVLPDLQRRRPERMLKTLAITSDSPVLTRYGPGILFRLKAQGLRLKAHGREGAGSSRHNVQMRATRPAAGPAWRRYRAVRDDLVFHTRQRADRYRSATDQRSGRLRARRRLLGWIRER